MAKRKNELPWTDGEIITHYRQAANPYVIIGVLADLNDVSKERIRAVLRRAGIDPPTKRTKKKQSFKRNHYILVAEDGTRYTTGELARKTGHAQSNIWNKAHAKEEITLDGRKIDGEWIELTDDGQKHEAVFIPRVDLQRPLGVV